METIREEIENLIPEVLSDSSQSLAMPLGDLELKIRSMLHQVGSHLLEGIINLDGGGHQGTRITYEEKKVAEFTGYRTKTVITLFGSIQIKRAYYFDFAHRRGVVPKDEMLDIVQTSFSPGVRKMMAYVGANESFERGRQSLATLAGISLKTKAVERVSEDVGKELEAIDEKKRDAIMSGE